MAETAIITLTSALSHGVHNLTAKQKNIITGAISQSSNSLTITIDTTLPNTPVALTQTSLTQTGVQLSWTADTTEPVSYLVYRNNLLIATTATTNLTDS